MEKKKKSTLFTRLFGNRNKVTDFMTEEQLQSPGRLILKNFLHNRLGMIGLIVFLLIFLLVMIGPKFYPLDLSYQDNTQLNVAPGMNMMSIPDGMKHKVADISPGTTYGVGADTDGNVYIWGYTKITDTIDLKNIPDEVREAKIVNVAAGYDHIVALDENGANLSGGERQRISIARALLRKSPILLVDEATAALDAATARAVSFSILNLVGMTRIVVTHRLEEAILRRYDKILVMKNGTICEQGNFDTLMQQKGQFYSLFQIAH